MTQLLLGRVHPCGYYANTLRKRPRVVTSFSGEGRTRFWVGTYFHNAPNVDEFACENMRRLRLIHQFDGLRADRCAGAHGLDLIVPFLDKNFIDVCMKINQNDKIGKIEKKFSEKRLRDIFHEILWRQKDGMSDAVGTNWVDEERTTRKITWMTHVLRRRR